MIRILGIAPYEGMKNLMQTLAQMRDDMQLDVHIGDYLAGLDIVENTDISDYDVIISRGGTADLIREHVTIPVVSIQLSQYDVLNVIKLAQSYNGAFAIVGFPSTVKIASMLCELLQYDIPIYTTHNEDEMKETIIRLQKQQISMVLGDNMIARHAQAQGLHSILITSGSESITAAFDEAVRLSLYFRQLRQRNDFYHTALKLNRRRLVIMQPNGQILFTDIPSALKPSMTALAKKMQPSVLKNGRQQKIRRINRRNYMITGDILSQGHERLLIFEISELALSASASPSGLILKESGEITNDFVQLFYGSASALNIQKKLASFRKARAILLTGEQGCGKDSLAEYIYSSGSFSQNALCIIDCEVLGDKALTHLLSSNDSPLFFTGHVIYFRRFEKLTGSQRSLILQMHRQGALSSGNQLIFSVQESGSRPSAAEADCVRELMSEFSCVLLHIPPLRQRIHEIPSLITLYLNTLERSGQHQIAGIEPEGMTFLQSFRWPGNTRQLCRIIKVLYDMTDTSYIHTGSVRDVLNGEDRIASEPAAEIGELNINRPLNDIIREIILMLLAQEGMTQSKAAEQLGICRTTLWRYLRKQP